MSNLNPDQFGPNPGFVRRRNVNVYRTREQDRGLILGPNPNKDDEPQVQLEDKTVAFGDQAVHFPAGVYQRDYPRPKSSLGKTSLSHMN